MRSLQTCSLAVFLLASAATAQESISTKDLDRRLETSLYDVAKAGTDLYNRQNNEEGCYRLYEGALRTAVPLLGHHAELKARVAAALQQSASEPPVTRSHTLRDAIDDIRKTVRPKPVAAPTANKPLWERLGGEAGARKLIREAGNAAGADPKVNISRGGKFKVDPERMENMLVAWLSSRTGGPLKYTGRELQAAHTGMKITDAEFDALLGHISDALKANNVAEKDMAGVLAIVRSTRGQIVEAGPAPAPAPAPAPTPKAGMTLWQRLGGVDAVTVVVRECVAKAANDPKVNLSRDGKYKLDDVAVAKLNKLLVEFVSSVSGGPVKYTGRDMKTVHAGMKITAAEFEAMAADLVDVLKNHNVAQADIDELIRAVAGTKKDIVEK